MTPVNEPRTGTLVIHRGALGDLLGAAPTLQALRSAYPHERITLLTHPDRGELLRRCGLVDEVRDVNAAQWLPVFAGERVGESTHQLLGGHARCVAWVHDPAAVLETTLRSTGIDPVIVWRPFGRAGGRPHAEHLVEVLPKLGIEGALSDVTLRVHPEDHAAGTAWVARHLPTDGRPLVAVHPGSGSPQKNWPAEAFAEVLAGLRSMHDVRSVVVLGPAEYEGATGLVALRGHADAVADGLPLPLLAGVMQQCAAWLGNDAGTTHLAALLGVPTVAIFGGASDPAVWAPRGPAITLVHAACGPEAAFDGETVGSVVASLRAAIGARSARDILTIPE